MPIRRRANEGFQCPLKMASYCSSVHADNELNNTTSSRYGTQIRVQSNTYDHFIKYDQIKRMFLLPLPKGGK